MLKDLRLDNLFPYLMSTKFISILTHCVEIRPRNTNDGRFEALIKFPRNTVRISLNHKACCEETVRKQLSRDWLQETGVSAPVRTCSNFRERNKIRHIFSLSYLSFFLSQISHYIYWGRGMPRGGDFAVLLVPCGAVVVSTFGVLSHHLAAGPRIFLTYSSHCSFQMLPSTKATSQKDREEIH